MNEDLLALAQRLDAENALRAWHPAVDRIEQMHADADGNPLVIGADFRNEFCAHIEAAEINDLADLVQADRALHCMYTSELRLSRAYALLREKARSFIERFPQLLETGWVHAARAIDELM